MELKIPLQASQFLEFEHWLRGSGIRARQMYPDRTIHSAPFIGLTHEVEPDHCNPDCVHQ